MTLTIHVPPQARDVEAVRKQINVRFKDYPGLGTNMLRPVAHAIVSDILVGNYANAARGMEKLGPDGARDMRTYLKDAGLDLELAA